MKLKEEFLNILACPKCKSAVEQREDWLVCVNANCGLQYPIRDGIPVMLINEAKAPQKETTRT